jgi:hypothetical protein
MPWSYLGCVCYFGWNIRYLHLPIKKQMYHPIPLVCLTVLFWEYIRDLGFLKLSFCGSLEFISEQARRSLIGIGTCTTAWPVSWLWKISLLNYTFGCHLNTRNLFKVNRFNIDCYSLCADTGRSSWSSLFHLSFQSIGLLVCWCSVGHERNLPLFDRINEQYCFQMVVIQYW